MKMKTLHITIGLPGSGKTTWSKKAKKSTGYNIHYDADSVENKRRADLIERLHYRGNYQDVIIDSVITTHETLKKLLSLIFDKEAYGYTHIELHVWNPDREACLWNDKGRRERLILQFP